MNEQETTAVRKQVVFGSLVFIVICFAIVGIVAYISDTMARNAAHAAYERLSLKNITSDEVHQIVGRPCDAVKSGSEFKGQIDESYTWHGLFRHYTLYVVYRPTFAKQGEQSKQGHLLAGVSLVSRFQAMAAATAQVNWENRESAEAAEAGIPDIVELTEQDAQEHYGFAGPLSQFSDADSSAPQEPQDGLTFASSSARFALLVGVDEYPDLGPAQQLKGCANDVAAMRKLLVDRFGFRDSNVTALINGAATGQAIRLALHGLVEQVAALPARELPAQIVFHFSGHGSQIADQPRGDPSRDEGDFLDETLVPSDAKLWIDDDYQDIRDDEIFEWVEQISQDQRAKVFVVCDCSHFGTGSRGATNIRQLIREDLNPTPYSTQRPSVDRKVPTGTVFLSACRAGEVEPEIQDGEETYGLLTRFLVESLTVERELSRLSYRDLQAAIVASYQGDRRVMQAPSPMIAGSESALLSSVLGNGPSGDLPPYIKASLSPTQISLNAGKFHRVTEGALFELYQKPEDIAPFSTAGSKTANRSVAWLQTTNVDSVTSEAQVVEWDGNHMRVGEGELPPTLKEGFAVQRYHETGDPAEMRIKVVRVDSMGVDGPPLGPADASVPKSIVETLSESKIAKAGDIHPVWVTDVNKPCDLLIRLDGDYATLFLATGVAEILRQFQNVERSLPTSLRGGWGPIYLPSVKVQHEPSSLGNDESLTFGEYLRRIMKIRNILSLASVGHPASKRDYRLKLELLQVELDDSQSIVATKPFPVGPDGIRELREDQTYAFGVTNTQKNGKPVYVTALEITPNLGIVIHFPYLEKEIRLEPGNSYFGDPFAPDPPKDLGTNHAILFASHEPLDLKFLEQADLPKLMKPLAGGASSESLTSLVREQAFFEPRKPLAQRLERTRSKKSWYAGVTSWRTLPGDYGRLNTRFRPSKPFAFADESAAENTNDDNVKADQRLVVQVGHYDHVYSVAFSRDSLQVLTGSKDRIARLFDVATGREIRKFEGHSGEVTSVTFSKDSRQVLTSSRDGTARLWDVGTGKVVRIFEGHSYAVTDAAFSHDGQQVVTGSLDKTARLWQVDSGKFVRELTGHTDEVLSVVFSPDGQTVLTGSKDNTARLWNVATGNEIRRFDGHAGIVRSVAFSHSGTQVLTGSSDWTSRLWDVATGELVQTFVGHQGYVLSVDFSSDDRQVLTSSRDKTARLWDATSGVEIRKFVGHLSSLTAAVFSADGGLVLTGSEDNTARIFDRSNGNEIHQFRGDSSFVRAVAFAPDGRRLLTGSNDAIARVWDTTTGKELRRLKGHTDAVLSVAFSSDGRRAITGSMDKTARLWNVETGNEIRTFDGHSLSVMAVSFSPDDRYVLTGSGDMTARLWDAETGELKRTFKGHADYVSSAVFSPDGGQVLTASWDHTARIWDISNGQETHKFEGHLWSLMTAVFSPDGEQVLTSSWDGTARIWDAKTCEQIRMLEGHTDHVWCAVFSPDGQKVLTGSWDKSAMLWDAVSGAHEHTFKGHSSFVQSVAFSPDGRQVLTGSRDTTSRLWDTETGNELCKLVNFMNGWAVLDPDGRFDGSDSGAVEGLHWVIGDEPIALDQLKQRYYEPGLLAKVMGFNSEPLRDVTAFSSPKLFPQVSLTAPTDESSRMTIDLKQRDGGFGRVVVKINGKELTADARGLEENAQLQPRGDVLTLAVDLANDPRLMPGKSNKIEVFAFNEEGFLRSRGFELDYEPPGEEQLIQPDVWAIVVGVSDYRGDAIDLRFAAKDADNFAQAIRVAATRLFGADQLHLTRLSTTLEDNSQWPTRLNILKALRDTQQARPGDILIVYLAGHGVNQGGQDGDFHYLTSDASSAELRDLAIREQVALSSLELTEAIKQIPALKQVLILDTCASGQLVQKLSEKRQVSSSQIRALERVKDRTGMYVLAGCAADAVSYEASTYGQGLLTHSLLMGMQGAALREDQFVDVSGLFDFAADRVPELARDIGGIQRPVVASPRGGASFDIGQVAEEDKSAIPLQAPRPLVLRVNFQDEFDFVDTLLLGNLVNQQLRDISTRSPHAPLIFVDTAQFPSAYRLGGRYEVVGDTVSVRVVLSGGEEPQRFTVDGTKSDIQRLAEKIVQETQERLPTEQQ